MLHDTASRFSGAELECSHRRDVRRKSLRDEYIRNTVRMDSESFLNCNMNEQDHASEGKISEEHCTNGP